jgi:hypothetical protein
VCGNSCSFVTLVRVVDVIAAAVSPPLLLCYYSHCSSAQHCNSLSAHAS